MFLVSIYSNIVILGTSVLFVGNMFPAHSRATCSVSPCVLQAGLPSRGCSYVMVFAFFLSQQKGTWWWGLTVTGSSHS